MKKIKRVITLLLVTMIIVSFCMISNVTSFAGGIYLSSGGDVTLNKCNKLTVTFSVDASLTFNETCNGKEIRCTSGPDTASYSNSHTYNTFSWPVGTYTVQIHGWGDQWLSLYGYWYNNAWDTGWYDVATITVVDGGHLFVDSVVTVQPTCTKEGEERFVCENGCGAIHTEPIAALEHTYSYAVIAPTCTAEGYTSYRCTRCGDSYSDSNVPALGHSWDEGVVLIEPTLDEMGTTRYTCTRCDITNDVVDIPVLSGLDVQIYLANELIEKHLNGEFVTTRPGFDNDWESFTDVYYDAVIIKENGTSNEKDAAALALAEEMAKINRYLPIDVTELANAVALTPEKSEFFYTAESYSLWSSLRIQGYLFLSKAANGEKALADEAERDTLIADLTSAYNNLTLKDADYSRVDSLLAQYEALNRNSYNADDLADVDALIENTVVRGYKIDRQIDVDAMAQTIEEALNSLVPITVFEITDETTAIIEDSFIYGFEEGVTADEIESMISFVGTADMQIVETANGLGTGSQIIFTDADSNVLLQLTVVIFGDANGDGWIDVFDSAIVSEIANSGADVEDYICKALDINNDEFVDAYDISMMNSIINMEVAVSQDGKFTVS